MKIDNYCFFIFLLQITLFKKAVFIIYNFDKFKSNKNGLLFKNFVYLRLQMLH